MATDLNSNNARNLRIRVKPYLDDLRSRTKTNREVAALLGCNEQTLCRVLKGLGVEKEAAIDRTAQTELNKARKAHRTKCANEMTPEEAAKACGVSVRTIYRYIGKK